MSYVAQATSFPYGCGTAIIQRLEPTAADECRAVVRLWQSDIFEPFPQMWCNLPTMHEHEAAQIYASWVTEEARLLRLATGEPKP